MRLGNSKQATITFNNNQFLLSGELDFSNVMLIYEKSLSQLKQAQQLNFDFSQLHSSNSAGLALIVEWIKYAKQHKKKISLTNLPDNLLSIAKAAGIDKLIP